VGEAENGDRPANKGRRYPAELLTEARGSRADPSLLEQGADWDLQLALDRSPLPRLPDRELYPDGVEEEGGVHRGAALTGGR